MWPQYTWLALALVGTGIVIAKHGQPQSNYNAWSSLISTGLVFCLLYAGGFFKGMM